jgi:hypothetical protein
MVILIVRFIVWSHLDVTVPADHILRFSLACIREIHRRIENRITNL